MNEETISSDEPRLFVVMVQGILDNGHKLLKVWSAIEQKEGGIVVYYATFKKKQVGNVITGTNVNIGGTQVIHGNVIGDWSAVPPLNIPGH